MLREEEKELSKDRLRNDPEQIGADTTSVQFIVTQTRVTRLHPCAMHFWMHGSRAPVHKPGAAEGINRKRIYISRRARVINGRPLRSIHKVKKALLERACSSAISRFFHDHLLQETSSTCHGNASRGCASTCCIYSVPIVPFIMHLIILQFREPHSN